MKKTIYTGTATALVTPFTATGVDYEALGRLIEFQIQSGINALVPMGTTGENPTVSDKETLEVIRFTVEKVAGRVPVIAGTGTNCTAHVIENTKKACEAGVDAVLVVTPYYNKATQSGLVAHFTAVADEADVPVVLYNVPGRTGCNIQPKTLAELAKHPNIVALKEASGNMAQFMDMLQLCGDEIDIYSGEDGLTVPMMAMGAKGTISVLSNVVPAKTVEMTNAALAGDFETAKKLQLEVLPLVNALFSQVNPIPAKAAVSAMGYGEEILRLPLTPMEEPMRSVLFEEMRKLGVRV